MDKKLKSWALFLVGSLVISSYGLQAHAAVITYSDSFGWELGPYSADIRPNGNTWIEGGTGRFAEVPLFDPSLGTLTSALAWVEGTFEWSAWSDVETVVSPGSITPGGGGEYISMLGAFLNSPTATHGPYVDAAIPTYNNTGPAIFVATPGTYSLGTGAIPFGAGTLYTDPVWLEGMSAEGTQVEEIYDDGSADIVGWSIGSEMYGTISYWRHVYGTYNVTYTYEPTSVPEPSSLLLMGIGLAGLGFVRRKKKAH